MNLVAVEERFGSWLTQYGYCNYITAEKLLELGAVSEKGEIHIKGKRYSTLVALFEPLPNKGLLDKMGEMARKGGKVIWFGPPPIINDQGENCLSQWQDLFGVKYTSSELQGRPAPGMRIDFVNQLKDIPAQIILSDFMIDRIYPVEPESGTSTLALCDNNLLVGTGKGNAWYFGFRPRDDQSASLGYETRTLFEILDRLGAYQATGAFSNVNDNPEHVSRTSDYLVTRFPNGTTVVVRHYRNHRETWAGGFSRNEEEDAKALAANPLPAADINLAKFKVNGHEVTYQGRLTMAFRMNADKELIAFEGQDCNQCIIDGKTFRFAESALQKIAFAPASDENSNEIRVFVKGGGKVSIPLTGEVSHEKVSLLNPDGQPVKHVISDNSLSFNLDPSLDGKWLKMKMNK
jgi:hypothetical protein